MQLALITHLWTPLYPHLPSMLHTPAETLDLYIMHTACLPFCPWEDQMCFLPVYKLLVYREAVKTTWEVLCDDHGENIDGPVY